MCGIPWDRDPEVARAFTEAISTEYAEFAFWTDGICAGNIEANRGHVTLDNHIVWRAQERDLRALRDMERRLGWA